MESAVLVEKRARKKTQSPRELVTDAEDRTVGGHGLCEPAVIPRADHWLPALGLCGPPTLGRLECIPQPYAGLIGRIRFFSSG